MIVRLALVAMFVGLLAGTIARGRLSNLVKLPVRRTPLLAVFLGATIAAHQGLPGAFAFLLVGLAAFAVFAFSNALAVRGLLLVGVGLTLNFVVIADNHGMPYRPSAIVSAGAAGRVTAKSADLVPSKSVAEHPESPADQLVWLADIIPLRPLHEVISVGDLLIGVGLGLVVFHGVLGDGMPRARRVRSGLVAESIAELEVEPHAPDLAEPVVSPAVERAAEIAVPAPTIWDERVRLLKATGDITVVLDLTDVPNGDAPESLIAQLAVSRALRGLPLPGESIEVTQ